MSKTTTYEIPVGISEGLRISLAIGGKTMVSYIAKSTVKKVTLSIEEEEPSCIWSETVVEE